MNTCKHCGKDKGRNDTYCSNKCQAAFQNQLRLQKWLNGDEDIVASNHSRNNGWLKQYLYECQNNRCNLCGNKNMWNGLELVFVLDHIDGNPSNNKRENLRLVCPNCDSQLATFKARNTGNGRHTRRLRYAKHKSY